MNQFNLVMQILLEIKNTSRQVESDQVANKDVFKEYDKDEVHQVIVQLIADKYINAVLENSYYDGTSTYMIYGLTNLGISELKNNSSS